MRSAVALTVRGDDGVPRPGRGPSAATTRSTSRCWCSAASRPGRRPAAGATRVVVRRDGAQLAAPAVVTRHIDARIRTGDGRLIARRPAIELRADIRAGDSGAPVVQDGRVAGIVFARSRVHDGVAYAIDAAVLARLLRDAGRSRCGGIDRGRSGVVGAWAWPAASLAPSVRAAKPAARNAGGAAKRPSLRPPHCSSSMPAVRELPRLGERRP